MSAEGKSLPRIGITMGDPAGIGPEIVLKALSDPDVSGLADFTVFGDERLLRGGRLPTGVAVTRCGDFDYSSLQACEPSALGGKASVAFILAAIKAAQQGEIDAIVTAPIHKQAVKMAGYPWPGHTELLAEKFASPRVAMMFAGGPFRIVLATIHIPLADVPAQLTTEGILDAICLADSALRRWFVAHEPRLGVLGLNPHASDGGRFGDEEARVIVPAIEQAVGQGIAATGPLSADTAFRQAIEGRFDCLVAMYHDQALIPVKTIAFGQAVNITLGIDCIRTSVDHGTAYDIAGKGIADASSMVSTIRMAAAMASKPAR